MRTLAISGSLDRASSNAAILALGAAAVPPPDEVLVYESVDDLPYFSPDRDHDPLPGPVRRWRDAVGAADAVLIATPEYAGGMPGVLKNALDWLVPSGELYGKPAVVVSAAPGPERGGGARKSVELTLAMQGARVCDSFTVAVRRSDPREKLAAQAVEAVARAMRKLDT
jgi:NAD(P)H-dependent FMN reductase